MKILKIILGLLLLLILFLVGKGLMTPSVEYDCEVTVNKPAAESWAVMSDSERLPDWIDGFIRTEHVSGEMNTVGAVSNVYVDQGGQEAMMKETINAITPNEHLDMTFTMDFMDMDYKIDMAEKDGQTQIRSSSVTRGNGLFAKIMVSLMPSAMKDQEQKNLNNLKKVIEENTKNYFPEPLLEPESATLIEE